MPGKITLFPMIVAVVSIFAACFLFSRFVYWTYWGPEGFKPAVIDAKAAAVPTTIESDLELMESLPNDEVR